MNNRDPFSLRRSPSGSSFAASVHSSLSRSAAAAAAAAKNSLSPSSPHDTRSLDPVSAPLSPATPSNMAYPVARHAHASSSSDQYVPDANWQPRRPQQDRHASGFEEKFNDLFGSKDGLPMYKDKPYNYSASKRRLPLWRRNRLIFSVLAVLALLLYWMGFFSSATSTNPSSTTSSGSGSKTSQKIWDQRREKVKQAFQTSWKAYEHYGWGFDKFHPVSKTHEQMSPDGIGWIIVDALDTMMIMNLSSELVNARRWVRLHLDYDQDQDVNTFETTIRMLGGLLSAHYLSIEHPDWAPLPDLDAGLDKDLYIEKAADLATRLLGAFESPSGIPYASINLKTKKGIEAHDNGGASSTAEAGTLQLEFKYLAQETGEVDYWKVAERAIQAIDDNGARDGLVPIYIFPEQSTFKGENIRLGSRGDSYYEYLLKQYYQTEMEEHIYLQLWEQAFAGVKKHLITYSEHSNLTVLAERQSGLDGPLTPKMDHLVCFMPGTIALATTGGDTIAYAKKHKAWTKKQQDEMELAQELMKTCWGMYEVTATGLAPEISYFHVAKPEPMMADGVRKGPEITKDPNADWRKDYDIHGGDVHNLQRPETVESLFYMWRITEDEIYREWGWQMFEAFMKHTFVSADQGFTSLSSVQTVPATQADNMESFWLSETLKYFYLLFSPTNILPLDDIVFNTEAHPLPRFHPSKIHHTGWQRKPRDQDGRIIEALGATPSTTPAPAASTKSNDAAPATSTSTVQAAIPQNQATDQHQMPMPGIPAVQNPSVQQDQHAAPPAGQAGAAPAAPAVPGSLPNDAAAHGQQHAQPLSHDP